MKKAFFISVLIFTLIFAGGCERWYSRLSSSGKIAADFLKSMCEEDFQSAYELLNDELKVHYSGFYSLEMEWVVYKSIFGQYLSVNSPKLKVLAEGKEMYKFTVNFSNGTARIEITVQDRSICELKTYLSSSIIYTLAPKDSHIDLKKYSENIFKAH